MDLSAFLAIAIIIFLILTLIVTIYYGLLSVDSSSFIGTENTVIPIAVLFLLITNGFFMGNNGFTGDFGLDYCNDKDGYTAETERVVVHSNSFFACELGYVNGVVDLGWTVSSFTYSLDSGISPSYISGTGSAMILNHENYKNFVNGETYGFSNFYLSALESSLGSDETSKYKVGITLHSDTYFFVVDRGYRMNWNTEYTGDNTNWNMETERGRLGPNSPTGSTANPLYFHYTVDLDYDTSGVVTTN